MNPIIKEAFEKELEQAKICVENSDYNSALKNLERAHVLGQNFIIPHAITHWHMLKLELKAFNFKNAVGQIVRLFLGLVGSAIGILPMGNVGSNRVSMFKKMPIASDLQKILNPSEK